MQTKLSVSDWVTLATKLGAPIVMAIIEARAKRRAELAEITPQLADMPVAEFRAIFGNFGVALDSLSDAFELLVEAGAAEKAAAGGGA